jgi:hypothetical protein
MEMFALHFQLGWGTDFQSWSMVRYSGVIPELLQLNIAS